MAQATYTPIQLYFSTTAAAIPTAGNLANGELGLNISDMKLYAKNSGGTVTLLASSSGASGSVTSVAQSFTGGIVSVAGSPITTSGTLALTVAGTSGGVPYFSSASTWASSTALTQYGVVIGGGAGAAPTSTAAGTTTTVLHGNASGTPTFGAVSLTADVSGTLPVVNGGTGLTSFTANGVVFASSSSVLATGSGLTFDGTNLSVAGRLLLTTTSSPNAQGQFGYNATGGTYIFSKAGSTQDFILYRSDGNSGLEMTAAGNLGLGVTPAAWISSYRALIVGYASNGMFSGGNVQLGLTQNAFLDSGVSWRYSTSNPASQYIQQSGVHTWRSAASGTAGNTITFNSAMTLDASENLGIGTTSPTSGLQTAGSSSKSAFKTPNIAEVDTISATAATGTIQYDVTTQSVLYYTSNASGNFTVNFRGSSGTSLNTMMQTGESISATFLVTNGATAYYNSAVTIDGVSVTPKWQGGTAPTSGNASSIDSYTYVIQKTGSATYVVLAAQTKFA